MWGWWTVLDGTVERAVLHRLTGWERTLLYVGLTLIVVLAVIGSWFWPGQAAELLFVQLALLVFFFGLRVGLAWMVSTCVYHAMLVDGLAPNLIFIAFCVYGFLIAGITTRKFREARSHELQMVSSLGLARQVQLSLQPPPLVRCGDVEMASSIQSFRELGGDLVCWQAKGDGSGWFFLLGDVMGKGAQAALTAAYVKGLFDEVAQWASDPADLLLKLHHHLAQRTVVDSFLSAVCIETDSNASGWWATRAGFSSPFLLRADGSQDRVTDAGMMLGLPFEPELEVTRWERLPGDQVIVASDGLLEEEEAPEALMATLAEGRNLSPVDSLLLCVRCLRERGEISVADDQTAVLLRAGK